MLLTGYIGALDLFKMCDFGEEEKLLGSKGLKISKFAEGASFSVGCLWEPKFILREQCIAGLRVDFNSSISASNSWTFDLPHSTMASPVLSF